MFGIGPTELIVILVVGLLILGPKRLPELARTLGKGFAEFRRASNELRSQIETPLDEPPTPPAAPPPKKPSKLPPEHPSARSPEDQLNAAGDIPLATSTNSVEDTPPKKTATTIWDEPEPSSEKATSNGEDVGDEEDEPPPGDEGDGVHS